MLFNAKRTIESEQLSPAIAKARTDAPREDEWPGIDSRFRLIVVAALRNKQLLRGAHPRIDADPLRRKNLSVALEEVKRGLVPFTITGHEA